MTIADWLAMDHRQGLHEIIDGELLMAPSPSIAHQRISRELEFRLYSILKESAAGEVFDAPTGVRLADDTVLEPDLIVVLSENADRVREQYIDGAPDLVVEILSPGTAARDLGVKREHYQRAGVREYWVVDPQSRTIEVLSLERGAFSRAGLFGERDTLKSPLLADLAIDLGEIWKIVQT